MAKRRIIFIICNVLCSLEYAVAAVCPLKWNDPNGTGVYDPSIPCPYGHRLPGDVTLPNNAGFGDYISVVYGYLPFVVVGCGVFELLFLGPLKLRQAADESRRIGTRELSFVTFCAVIVIFNEVVLKSLATQKRPEHSCNSSCGFPSGHSTMAVGFFTLMFLDGALRVSAKTPLTVEEARQETEAYRHHRTTHITRLTSFNPANPATRSVSCLRFITIVPLSRGDVMSHIEFAVFVSIWACLLLPVPISRLALEDHTVSQISVGGLLGAVEAALWFYFMRQGQIRWNKHLGKSWGILEHNYALPRFHVRSDCVRLLAKCVNEDDIRRFSEDLQAMKVVLNWYIKLSSRRSSHIRDAERFSLDIGRDLYPEYSFLELEIHALRQLQKDIDEKLGVADIRSLGQVPAPLPNSITSTVVADSFDDAVSLQVLEGDEDDTNQHGIMPHGT